MRRTFRLWSLVLIGLGVGVGAGWVIGQAALVVAAVVVVAGLVFAVVGSWQAPPELVARRAERKAHQAQQASRPALAGLGTRVEQVLRLAEEQANDHRVKAEREAEQILASARREAEAIISGAHAVAAEADVRGTPTPTEQEQPDREGGNPGVVDGPGRRVAPR